MLSSIGCVGIRPLIRTFLLWARKWKTDADVTATATCVAAGLGRRLTAKPRMAEYPIFGNLTSHRGDAAATVLPFDSSLGRWPALTHNKSRRFARVPTDPSSAGRGDAVVAGVSKAAPVVSPGVCSRSGVVVQKRQHTQAKHI